MLILIWAFTRLMSYVVMKVVKYVVGCRRRIFFFGGGGPNLFLKDYRSKSIHLQEGTLVHYGACMYMNFVP